jgi:Ran GTPase-activating protein (RanGAP) involved in mRNA processing and transport
VAQLGPRELLALSMNSAKLATLTTLCMPRNAVDDGGMRALVAGLKAAAVVKNLDLSGNKLTHRGAQVCFHRVVTTRVTCASQANTDDDVLIRRAARMGDSFQN